VTSFGGKADGGRSLWVEGSTVVVSHHRCTIGRKWGMLTSPQFIAILATLLLARVEELLPLYHGCRRVPGDSSKIMNSREKLGNGKELTSSRGAKCKQALRLGQKTWKRRQTWVGRGAILQRALSKFTHLSHLLDKDSNIIRGSRDRRVVALRYQETLETVFQGLMSSK
jgi:hypothetical protein